jgi:hypothetical protein
MNENLAIPIKNYNLGEGRFFLSKTPTDKMVELEGLRLFTNDNHRTVNHKLNFAVLVALEEIGAEYRRKNRNKAV